MRWSDFPLRTRGEWRPRLAAVEGAPALTLANGEGLGIAVSRALIILRLLRGLLQYRDQAVDHSVNGGPRRKFYFLRLVFDSITIGMLPITNDLVPCVVLLNTPCRRAAIERRP